MPAACTNWGTIRRLAATAETAAAVDFKNVRRVVEGLSADFGSVCMSTVLQKVLMYEAKQQTVNCNLSKAFTPLVGIHCHGRRQHIEPKLNPRIRYYGTISRSAR